MDLLIFDHDLVDQQADIGLPQCAIVAPKPIAEETPESTDYLRAIERRPDLPVRIVSAPWQFGQPHRASTRHAPADSVGLGYR